MRFRLSAGLLLSGTVLIAAGLLTHAVTNASPGEDCPEARDPVRMSAQGVLVSQAAPGFQPTPAVQPFVDQACLDCHTDEEQLKVLAVAEEPAESLSEGPG